MQVYFKGSDAKRIFICGRIIVALDNGAFEITEDEYNANTEVFEPVNKKNVEAVEEPKSSKEENVKEDKKGSKK